MRISELVEELNQIREQRGDLLVAVDKDGEHHINVYLSVVANTNTNLKNSFEEVIIVNEAYFLGIY